MGPARLARQPALGLAGITLVIPVMVVLAIGYGGPERSLLVLGPMSTFALPAIAMIAFWWNDWPGTILRPPLTGLLDTLLVALAGVLFTILGQAIVLHLDLRGVFDPDAGPAHAAIFPDTMPPAGAVFVAMLEITLVSERWPLRGANRFAGGVAAVALAWIVAIVLWEALVARAGAVSPGDFAGALTCIGTLQVLFYVVYQGRPFRSVRSFAPRLFLANATVVVGGVAAYLLPRACGAAPAAVAAVAGSTIAAGLVVGMLFEGWLDALMPPPRARLAALLTVAGLAAVLYLALKGYAEAIRFVRAEPEEWIAYVGLNAIGAGVILHVAIGHRWPFGGSERRGSRSARPRRRARRLSARRTRAGRSARRAPGGGRSGSSPGPASGRSR
ncbi:MAG TPA: hypothetical protein VHA80_12610 [Solirubrobacterales bacterium]|nr:hypothetical protein [Solirubrobacterales bacterium]